MEILLANVREKTINQAQGNGRGEGVSEAMDAAPRFVPPNFSFITHNLLKVAGLTNI